MSGTDKTGLTRNFLISATSGGHRIVCLAAVALAIAANSGQAAPAGAGQARAAIKGWLRQHPQAMAPRLGQTIDSVSTVTNVQGEALYHIVKLNPTGFVLVSGDDELQPVIAFSEHRDFDPGANPVLSALLQSDLPKRVDTIRGRRAIRAGSARAARLTAHRGRMQDRWRGLRRSGERMQRASSDLVFSDDDEALLTATGGELSEVRVAPLVAARWNQGSVGGQYCYNYYTPNHYYAGCVATAMAQLMRHFQHPTTGVGTASFQIYVDGVAQSRTLRGGNGFGGAYGWGDMVLSPSGASSDTQRRAIGALCYDAGVAAGMSYTGGGSGASLASATTALLNTFEYNTAVHCSDYGSGLGEELVNMVHPNLDAGVPVILAIWGDGGGHAVLCDGYGYQDSTLYHHLNMGWGGADDAWYNLPDINAYYDFDTVETCVYNVHPSGSGEIVSGRVFDLDGYPVAGAIVTARAVDGSVYSATSGANGIYAVRNLPSNGDYDISADAVGHVFPSEAVSVGRSRNYSASGNRWGINLNAVAPDDYGSLIITSAMPEVAWSLTSYPATYTGPRSGTGPLQRFVPPGAYSVTFGAVAGWRAPVDQGGTVVEQLSLTLHGTYDGIPTLSDPGIQHPVAGQPFSLALSAHDPDGSIPSMAITSGPEGMILADTGTGLATLHWTPGVEVIGEYTVTVEASDGALSTSLTIPLDVLRDYPWPAGELTDTRQPTFLWAAAAQTQWHHIWITRNGSLYYTGWQPTTSGQWQPHFEFGPGNYTWWVRGWGVGIGTTPWSSGVSFSIPARIPSAPLPLGPAGDVHSTTQTLEWDAAEHATWYQVWLNRNGAAAGGGWTQGQTMSCELSFGHYRWWVRGWGPDGGGAWSSGTSFRYGVAQPTAPMGLLEGNPRPEFHWSSTAAATWHRIYMVRNGVAFSNTWVEDATTWQPASDLPPGTYQWWVMAWSPTGAAPWSDAATFVCP